MKKISFFFALILLTSPAFNQNTNDDLPVEFQNVAQQAFQKLSPANRQWFTETAKQHPPGKFDANWTKTKLVEKFGAANVDVCGELFAVMMAYQKMMNKEAREDRKLARDDKKLELEMKNEKIKKDNAAIDKGMEESREKADRAMTAAQTDMWIGIVSGNLAIGGSSGSFQGQTGNTNNQLVKGTPVRQIDSSKLRTVYAGEKIKTTETQKGKEEATKAAADRKRAMTDAVKKLQDQMAEMNKKGL